MGVSYVPLADAVAVTFIAPLLVTIMGALLLGEYVGIHRWTAVIVGFVGTLVIIRPGFDSFHPALILPLSAACLFAGRQVISRFLSGNDKTETTVAYTAIASTLILSLPIPFVWITPQTSTEILLIISMASMAAIAELLVIKALEVALAVVVSPMQYTIIIWSSFYGFMVFDQLPDRYTVGGTAIIILSGLYTLHRERLRKPVTG
jgi:S-adenosylmethionine uptake transporter